MKITKESDINGQTMKDLRIQLGLSQKTFWGAVCVSNASGSNYEKGNLAIPAPISRLLFLHYGAGIPTTSNNLPELMRLGKTLRAHEMLQAGADLLEPADGR